VLKGDPRRGLSYTHTKGIRAAESGGMNDGVDGGGISRSQEYVCERRPKKLSHAGEFGCRWQMSEVIFNSRSSNGGSGPMQ